MHKYSFRSVWLTFCFVILLVMSTACSSLTPSSPTLDSGYRSYQSQVEVNQRLQEILEQLRSELRKDLQSTLKEELLPAIQGLNYVSEDVRKKQQKAKRQAVDKIVLGRVEWVTVSSQKIQVRARIDSGAASSSIHADNIQEQERDGKTYVQFETYDEDDKSYVLLKEVIKTTKVRSASGTKTRYVVPMRVRIGNKEHDIHVNLVDRDKLTYKFLVGRDLLMGKYVIDVSQSRLLGK